MTFTVYSKNGCPACEKAIQLLTKKQANFDVIKISAETGEGTISLSEFKQLYPKAQSVPYIVQEGSIVGGFNELHKLLAS